MGIVNKILGDKKSSDVSGYIDLEKYVESTGGKLQGAKMHVRVGEIQRYEDLKDFSDYVYGGNVLILDLVWSVVSGAGAGIMIFLLHKWFVRKDEVSE